jgi:cysteine synthase A
MGPAVINPRPAPCRSIVEASELPKLIRLADNLYVAAFTLMKLLPARFMLDRAEQRGELVPGTTVLETSSGTFGLGLAMVCRLRGYDLKIVGDPAIDAAMRRRLGELGAQTIICPEPSPEGGYQRARLDRLAELRAELPRHYVPEQYSNPDNGASYAMVAELLADSVGRVDCLVGAVGSGGSTGGTASFLRLVTPELRLLGVDTPGSRIFGQADRPRLLRGLGNSLTPPNVRHDLYDEIHWVGAAEAFRCTRRLHAEHCLFMGPTSGAAFMVARWYAARNPDATVVAILPDEGHRYQATVYSDAWLHEQGVSAACAPGEPTWVWHPGEVPLPDGSGPGAAWAAMDWNRRSLAEVLGRTGDAR